SIYERCELARELINR
nr:RecName: Full=Lysozyme-like peptide [Tityus stigmurus]